MDDIIQCADVLRTTHRKWIRLVGLGYDLQLWAADPRNPPISTVLPYSTAAPHWVKDIVDPWRELALTGEWIKKSTFSLLFIRLLKFFEWFLLNHFVTNVIFDTNSMKIFMQ